LFDKQGANVTREIEEERIAVRCTRRELQQLDSFVLSGEFSSRSELIRAALRDFLSRRARAALVSPGTLPAEAFVRVPVRLRAEERDLYEAYCELVANGAPLEDILAQWVRRGALEARAQALVEEIRGRVRAETERRHQLQELERSGEDLQKRGLLGP